MADLIHAPFEPGLTDSADPVITNGRLYQAENVRFHKQARVAKRYGLEPVSFVTQSPSGAYETRHVNGMTGAPNAIGNWRGAPFLASDATLALIAADTTQGVTGTTRATTLVPNKLSRALPRRTDTIAFNPNDIAQSYAVKHGNNILHVWNDATATYYCVRTPDGVTLKQQRFPQGATQLRAFGQDSRTTILSLGDGAVVGGLVLWTISHISHDFIEASAERHYPFATQLATPHAAAPWYDACPFGTSGEFFVVYQSSATELTVARFNGSTQTATRTVTTGTIVTGLSIGVVLGGSLVYVVYYDSTNNAYHVSFPGNLTNTNGPTLLSSTYDYYGQPGIYGYSATQALVVLSGVDSAAGNQARVTRSLLTDAAAVEVSPAANTIFHITLASQPFLLGTRHCAWFATANDVPGVGAAPAVTGWRNQRTYWLMDLMDVDGLPTNRPSLVMTATPMIASQDAVTVNNIMLPHAVNMTDFWLVPLLEVYKRDAASDSDVHIAKEVSWYDYDTGSSAARRSLYARRDHVEVNGALHFAGGVISEYAGGAVTESGFMHYPVIHELRRMTGAGGFGQASGSTFSYSAVYEWIGPNGERQRSQPSDPTSITIGSSDRIQIFTSRLAAGKAAVPTGGRFGEVVAHLYRTQVGGTIYYKTTDEFFAATETAGIGTGPTVAYTDSLTDASLASREILYTQGGVLGNIVPPAARYLAQGGNRVWLAGLLKPRRVVFSKLIVDGEPVQFPDDASFALELPEDITGIKWGDGSLIVFSENAIHVVSGDGPNDQGQGSFTTPQRLPSDVGCIEHHSIVETQDGWMFQSKRGIYLLPRGFGPPVFVGAEIQDTLLSYPTVRSAAVIADPGGVRHGETTVRYICADANGNTRVPVWDTALKRWVSVDKYEANDLALIGVHDDKCVVVRDNMGNPNPVRRELSTAWGDGGVGTGFVSSRIKTGNIRPFGLLGWGHVKRLHVIGEVREPVTLHARVSYDGATGVMLPERKKLGDIGARFQQQYALEKTQCNSIDVELWDGASGASEGLVFHGITLEVDPIEGLPRLGAEDRA